MELFDYQDSFVSDIQKALRKNRRVIGQLATGGGKGVVLANIAERAAQKGSVTCISCHREEIFQQLYANLRKHHITPGLIAPGHDPMPGHPVYLSMVETFCRRMNKGLTEKLNINFFILDEAHLGNYYKLVESTKCHILGFTATPKSTGDPELKEYFDDIVCGIPISELIRIGRLLKAETYSVKHDFSKVKMRGKDYDDKALFDEFKKPKLWEGGVQTYLERARGLQAICYCVNVEHSNATANQFRDHGIKAAHVDGKTDKETRKAIFDMFRRGDIEVLCNVGIATTGTDIPEAGCIIQNFATTSLVKHIQTLGRGARACEGMSKFIAIDMGRNYMRHGEFGEDIDWRFIFENPAENFQKKDKKDKRECDECGAVMRFHLKKCPYCDHEITDEEIERKFLEGASIEEVKAYRLKTVPPHLRRPFREMGKAELAAYAKHMGYSPRWVFVMLNTRNKK